jgi:hypothetical protein
MSAKNTVVNLMILATFISFILYRRAGKQLTNGNSRRLKILQVVIVVGVAAIVLYFGVYGYVDIFGLYGPPGSGTPAVARIGFSVYQVAAVLTALFFVTLLDIFLFRRAASFGPISWGSMPNRSQYALVLLAVTFTWLMGLMGYARNAIRQDWHVYGIVRDTSPDAFSPALGYAAIVISACVIIFLCFISFIFWLSDLGERYVKRVVTPVRPAPSAQGVEGVGAVQGGPVVQPAQPAGAQPVLEFQQGPAGRLNE